MSGKFRASLRYQDSQRHSSLPSSRNQLKFISATCPHETAFAFRWRVFPRLCFSRVTHYSSTNMCKRIGLSIKASMDTSGLNSPSANGNGGRTRLARAIQTLQVKLNARLQKLRSGFFMKALFFLVGFYCATAFSTVIGQTGDWDILSAGLAVIVVEGIGALMYKASFPLLNNIKSLITLFNYWKAGLSLGLFLDAFKY
ncbi:uncharacterized protein ycf20-like [Rhododendron vialii]|uniref:uncharacterized protein ycf20-like n=1 Tax=Rhododendron vialii TaxID=182163 RepID=UPI00265E4176|nr:uncharacterized protein ycf20-like [Rhododendron vialii]XP_058181687.1 uncharacterized protein ycf20-like [Rhododendron vialii]XP_058181688.1 uncharacterized protein ycf20-like [Rhododendron vialii]